MFRLVIVTRRYQQPDLIRTVATFPTYTLARRAARKLMFNQDAGLVSHTPNGYYEIARYGEGDCVYSHFDFPTRENYGKRIYAEDGYLV